MAKHYVRLSEILQRLLYENHLNASELARRVKLPIPTVHRLVTGKSTRPYRTSLRPIADFFKLEMAQLLGEEPIPGWNQDYFSDRRGHLINTVPLVEWEQLDNLKEARKTSTKELPVTGILSERTFALIMNDYSMEPTLPKGAVLVFDPAQAMTDRCYALLKLHQGKIPVVRQLLINGDETFLKPLNPELHSAELRKLHPEDEIIGRLYEVRVNHGLQ